MENSTEIHTDGAASPSRGVPGPSKGRSDKGLADDNWIKDLKYSLFPEELKALPQWVVWRNETRKNGQGEQKPTKVPFNAKTHKNAKATDPATWCDYATALREEEGYSGLGFALAPPYAVVDLDKVYNPQTGEVEPWAESIVSKLNSYTERSPSGTGFHIWVKGAIPPGSGNRKGRIEMYSEKRYMTVTGDHVPGAPLTIEERDLSGVHARMLEGIGLGAAKQAEQVEQTEQTEQAKQKEKQKKSKDASKFEKLFAGKWEGDYPSQSEADLALCSMLAWKVGPDPEKIDARFRESRLYRDKWEREDYRKSAIGKAIESYNERHPARPTRQATRSNVLPIIDVRKIEADDALPVLPPECLEGDYLGELARLLTDGTAMPPDFVYSTIKTVAAAIINGHVIYPHHPDLQLRHFNINVSVHPRTGKGEAWKRVGSESRGWLHSLMEGAGIEILDSGLFGSGQYLVKVLESLKQSKGRDKALVRFDEMKALYERNEGKHLKSNSTENMLLQLYEKTAVAHGSFENHRQEADCELSLSGDFTMEGFEAAFTGRGSQGSGFLARCVLSLAGRAPHEGDWRDIPEVQVKALVGKIRRKIADLVDLDDLVDPEDIEDLGDFENLPGVENLPRDEHGNFVPAEDEEACNKRHEFMNWLNEQDPKYTAELGSHFKRDMLLRTVFSNGRITGDKVDRSIAWATHQLKLRKRLWPEDGGSQDEIMEQRIIANLEKHEKMTKSQLIKFCNVKRKGCGGHLVFGRAFANLRKNGVIEEVAQTRVGTPIYALRRGD